MSANVDDDKVRALVAARDLAAKLFQLVAEESQPVAEVARLEFWDTFAGHVAAKLTELCPPPPPPPPMPILPSPTQVMPIRRSSLPVTAYDQAIALCDEIDDLVDDIPERGEDFAISVQEKARSIRQSIEQYGSATDNQLQALVNMAAAARRWIH